jgi:hypothetical protein
MKPIRKVLFVSGLACLVLAGCAKSPTKPDSFDTLKKNAADLAATLQNEVASFRGKNFIRNVKMAVYTKSQYASMIGSQITGISAGRRDTINMIYKCEGLLRANQDYYADYDSLLANQVGGFYKDGSDSVFLIVENGATELTYDDSVALFHEFVHALQDQYYDLGRLDSATASSDQYYALDYTVEGEAELLAMYYAYKLYFGFYPSSSDPVMYQFYQDSAYTNAYLDSLHSSGQPLLSYQPDYWAYYSYGPIFINAVVGGMNWSIIDNVIFAALPVMTSEIMHPQTYISKSEHTLNIGAFINKLDSTQVLYDVDELGEMLTCVMFREWNFGNYASIANGILADQAIVFSDSLTDSLRLIWYTLWTDQPAGAAFMTGYASLVQSKLNITLPAPSVQGTKTVYDDTVHCVYAEQDSSYAFVMEHYEPANRDSWIAQLRSVTSSVSVAKRAASAGRHYPCVKKRRTKPGVRL